MCRGKATQDFKGPDCRFVNFKKGEAVYVYYKLIGKSTELWAGSVSTVKQLFCLLFLALSVGHHFSFLLPHWRTLRVLDVAK